MTANEEFDTEQSHPELTVEQLVQAWDLGNLLARWAENPAAMDEEKLTRLRILGQAFGVDTTAALFQFQRNYRAEIGEMMIENAGVMHDAAEAVLNSLSNWGPTEQRQATMRRVPGNAGLPRRRPQAPSPFPPPGVFQPQHSAPVQYGQSQRAPFAPPFSEHDRQMSQDDRPWVLPENMPRPNGPLVNSGPQEADRALREYEQLLALVQQGGSLSVSEAERLHELTEIVGTNEPSSVRPYMEQHYSNELFEHQTVGEDGPNGTVFAIPNDVVGSTTETGHMPQTK